MITLETIRDYWIMLAMAAGSGAVGGLAFELLQTRLGQQSGVFERFAKREEGIDIGGFASIVLGAVAAIAVLYFFPPTITVTEGEVTTTQFDLVQLIALSLIVGSTGGVILQAAQQRVQQRIQSVGTVAQTQVQQVGSVAEEAANEAKEQLNKVVQQHNLDKALLVPVYGALTRLEENVQHEVDTGEQTLTAATGAPSQ